MNMWFLCVCRLIALGDSVARWGSINAAMLAAVLRCDSD